MTRLMADATTANAQAAIDAGTELVGAYNTGPGIKWTPAQLAAAVAAGKTVVLIDQGTGDTASAEAHAYVFDTETNAFDPSQAGSLIAASQVARPAPYVNQSNIVATVQSALTAPNWRGDTWVAIPGWQPGDPWPAPVAQAISLGAVIVAVQNRLDVNGVIDLSDVLDPTWPLGDSVNSYVIPGINGDWLLPPDIKYDTSGNGFCMGYGLDGRVWFAKQPVGQPWGQPAPL